VLDQVTKWWAWRQVSGVTINAGGFWLAGPTVGGWYASPVTGALLDLLGFGVMSLAVSVLVRRRRPALVVVSGALMTGGWLSNLLDRLGLHHWTAPGSVRGAVDFIHVSNHHYNVADFFILGATPLFLVAVACVGWRVTNGPARNGPVTHVGRRRLRARAAMSALAGAVCLVVVVMGVATYDGVKIPLPAAGMSVYP
jgi:lipoprotein signal peptidase